MKSLFLALLLLISLTTAEGPHMDQASTLFLNQSTHQAYYIDMFGYAFGGDLNNDTEMAQIVRAMYYDIVHNETINVNCDAVFESVRA